MSNDDIEKGRFSTASGLTVVTQIEVADWFSLGHHVGYQNSPDQTAFLDGLATAFESMGSSARATQIEYIGRGSAQVIGLTRRHHVAEFLEELAVALRTPNPDSLRPPRAPKKEEGQ